MYGNERAWGTDSIGVHQPASRPGTWPRAAPTGASRPGCWCRTPRPASVTVDLTFMTSAGPAGRARRATPSPPSPAPSFNVNDYVTDYDVSTKVTSGGGNVICERAMYGNERTWAHDSIGATAPAATWYLAEGCTDGGMETWVLVQNPNDDRGHRGPDLHDRGRARRRPQAFRRGHPGQLPPLLQPGRLRHRLQRLHPGHLHGRRRHLRAGHVRQRAHLGPRLRRGRPTPPAPGTWPRAAPTGAWRPGCWCRTPATTDVTVDLTFMTSTGPVAGPPGRGHPGRLPPHLQRRATTSPTTTSPPRYPSGGGVVCERAMYGNDRTWAHDSVGYEYVR